MYEYKNNFAIVHIFWSENIKKLNDLEIDISKILEISGEQFFEIRTLEKINNYKADIIFEILKTNTKHQTSNHQYNKSLERKQMKQEETLNN